jgi:hypothetical protein
MSGTQLTRPSLKNPVVEKKPEKLRMQETTEPVRRATLQENNEPTPPGPAEPTDNTSTDKNIWEKGQAVLKKLGGEIAKGAGQVVKWAGNLLKRIGFKR